ncbi:MAG: peptide ABC transporter substrate-binding protein [Deltaproteobacteria bacterium]|nr:MAG: peptide ABC transporter substrate-binding protein [Deltaproteobacteria bacterium]
MTIRRILIFAPLLIIIILLQSYFWVPTYEQQTRGNPNRLDDYIFASGGDASILNPVLSADVPSSRVENLVFDSLIDLDAELRYRGRLATGWQIYEEAYFYVNPSARIPGLDVTVPQAIVDLILDAKQDSRKTDRELQDSLDNIKNILVQPPRNFSEIREVKLEKTTEEKRVIKFEVTAPARIKMVLNRVDQELFTNLGRLLGHDYFSSFHGEYYVSSDVPLGNQRLRAQAQEILPATEHNPVIEFHLRPGVKFHDGHIFDAYDVRFTYQALMNPKNLSPRIADFEPVKSVAVIDPLTVRIVYKRLYSPALGTWSMGILPEHLLNSQALVKEAIRFNKDPGTFTMRDSRLIRNPTGCGPFVFRQWKSDQHIILDRFDDYWEGPPNYKRYIYRIIPDILTQEMEFYAGTIDSYGNPLGGIPPHQVQRLKNDPRYQNFSGTSLSYTYIGYNMRRKPFDDRRVRRALGMAIDVDKIIKYVLYNQGERTTGPFAKQTDFYNHRIKALTYDPQRALKLLKEVGWKRNSAGWLEKDGKKFQFTLITNSGNDIRKAILAIAQDAWKQIGIDVRTDLLEWSVFIQERVDKADFDVLILGWTTPINPDPYQVWHSSQTHPYQLNFVGFQNKQADELIIKIRQEYDHGKQVEYCQRFHELIAREQPYTFLYVPKWTAILDKRIVIKEQGADGKVRYKKIEPTKTGDYTFHFNKWIKLPDEPLFLNEG